MCGWVWKLVRSDPDEEEEESQLLFHHQKRVRSLLQSHQLDCLICVHHFRLLHPDDDDVDAHHRERCLGQTREREFHPGRGMRGKKMKMSERNWRDSEIDR